MRNDRDPYWRRRDESYWRGRQEAHASYWKLTRQIRKSEHQGRRHAAEVDRLSSDIEARRRADRQAALIAQMHKERQWLQGQIAACSSSRRDRWLRQLELLEPTASGAEAALAELRDDIERERRKLAAASLRTWSQASVPEPAELAWPTLGTVRAQMSLLGLEDLASAEQQTPTDPEAQRALCESALATIVSRVNALASPVRRYQAGAF